MYIVEVMPLVRGNTADALSYYCAEALPIGALVTMPLRKREVQGLVIDSKPVSAAKAALRAATFSLRKLPVPEQSVVLPERLSQLAGELARRYPASHGAILYALLPPDIRSGEHPYPIIAGERTVAEPTTSVLSGLTADRYISYRSHIRETFARRGSVLFVVPTIAHLARAADTLSVGIEKRVITLTHTHGKQARNRAYAALADTSEAKLIITTPNYAFLDRPDITSIVIDEAGSPYYRDRRRPYLDLRDVLKTYARLGNQSLLLGDLVVATEDEVRRRDDIYITYDEHVQRISFPASFSIVQRKETETPLKKKYRVLLPETLDAIERTIANKGRAFLYAARRGLAPAIVCYDCGHLFRCPDSGAPYALLRTYEGEDERRWFVSSTSGKRVRAADVCPLCGSWRLREQGLGIQLIEDEVREVFPDAPLIVFDSTTATTRNKADKLAETFLRTKGSLLLGTAMSIPYLPEQVDLSVVTSYEATRNMVSWRADERVFSLLLTLREHTSKETIVQLRSEPDQLLRCAERGALDAFYTDEISVRESLTYPPFSTFVLLSVTGPAEETIAAESTIDALVRNHTVQYYNAPDSRPERTTRHGLIRIPREKWPDPDLMMTLRNLPPNIKIEVDPDRIV